MCALAVIPDSGPRFCLRNTHHLSTLVPILSTFLIIIFPFQNVDTTTKKRKKNIIQLTTNLYFINVPRLNIVRDILYFFDSSANHLIRCSHTVPLHRDKVVKKNKKPKLHYDQYPLNVTFFLLKEVLEKKNYSYPH